MNNSNIAKIAGWGQFVFSTLGTVFGHGVPTNIGGWLALVGSFAAAIGIHGAASTDGAK